MAFPVIVGAGAIGLAVAFYMEAKANRGPKPGEGAEGTIGEEKVSSATGGIMGTTESGQAVVMEQTDSGPLATGDEADAIDIPHPSNSCLTCGSHTTAPTTSGIVNETPLVTASRERFGNLGANAARIAGKFAKKPSYDGTGFNPAGSPTKPTTGSPTKPGKPSAQLLGTISNKGLASVSASNRIAIFAAKNRGGMAF